MYIWSQVSSDIKKYLKKDEGIMPLELHASNYNWGVIPTFSIICPLSSLMACPCKSFY